jgi:hypothetical protein
MLSGAFEPAIPAIKRLQSYALERMATGIGLIIIIIIIIIIITRASSRPIFLT